MKKVNFKVVLVALSFSFIFLLGVGSVAAQSGATMTSGGGTGLPADKATAAIFTLPTGTFQGSQDALVTLKNEMTSIRATMAQIQNESDPVFISLAKLMKYYERVYNHIVAGDTVSQAIISGLRAFGGNADYLPSTPVELQTLKNSAIALLD